MDTIPLKRRHVRARHVGCAALFFAAARPVTSRAGIYGGQVLPETPYALAAAED